MVASPGFTSDNTDNHDAVFVQRAKEDMERYLLKKLADGADLDGTYPPNAAQIAEYEAYRASL